MDATISPIHPLPFPTPGLSPSQDGLSAAPDDRPLFAVTAGDDLAIDRPDPASRESADRPDTVRDLSIAAIAFVRSIETIRHTIAREAQLGSSEFRALSRVVEAGTITPKHLAVSLGLTTGAVTAVSDRLVKLKLIERMPHPSDRRSILLQLTQTGHNVMAGAYETLQQTLGEAVSASTTGTIDQLTALLASASTFIVSHGQSTGANESPSLSSHARAAYAATSVPPS